MCGFFVTVDTLLSSVWKIAPAGVLGFLFYNYDKNAKNEQKGRK